jgi:hypothetical protein
MVCGYVTFYVLKRHQPPTTPTPIAINEVVALLVALGAGGLIGGAFVALEGVNYIGGYGIGLLVGFVANVLLTIAHEDPFGWRLQKFSRQHHSD